MSKLKRATYFTNENFKFFLEEMHNELFVHVAFDKFSKEIYTEAKMVFAHLLVEVYLEGYDYLHTYTKDNRIIKMFGDAEYLGEKNDIQVWRWELK